MAHPTKPLILLYPQPPNSSEKIIFPSDSGTMALSSFGPASVLSVSGSGEDVFAYFPVTNGSNSGLCCIWEKMILKQFWAVDQGEAVVNCWWLSGNPRQMVTDQSGRPKRLPRLGPELAIHSTLALILMEDFTLQLVCESSNPSKPDGPFDIVTASALRRTAHGTTKRPKGMNPYTGYICTRASLGLGYNDSTILVAMQASLLPPPCLPLSETRFAGLGIPAATFITQPSNDDWEYTGTESAIRICEVSVARTSEKGWDIQTEPLSPIAHKMSAQLMHLQFVPKLHNESSAMSVDGTSQSDRYLVVATTEFGLFASTPKTEVSVYSLSKESGSSSTSKWNALLGSQDLDNVLLIMKNLDYEAKLDLIDSVWALLDSESGGGGAARWMVEYIQVLLLIDRSSSDKALSHPNRSATALNLLSLPVAKSALSECHGKDHEASYHPDTFWPLSEMCGWIIEFTESILSAASQFYYSIPSDSAARTIDPALLVFLNQSLVSTWVDSLGYTLRFVKHVDVPKGTSIDSKTLVTRSVEDTLSQSPVNVSLLLEALKGLKIEAPISAADWRNAYRHLILPERLVKVAKDIMSQVLKPDVVSLIPYAPLNRRKSNGFKVGVNYLEVEPWTLRHPHRLGANMSERQPLLGHVNGAHSHHNREGSFAKFKALLLARGQPSYLSSFKWFLFDSWWNILLAFIPLSFIAHHLNWDAAYRFSFSFFAIMPLARLLGEATDQLSIELGETLGALLNASFGNAVEIIVGVAALMQGELRIVQTSMLGSILSNILLVLGCAFFAGGVKRHEGVFEATGAQAASSVCLVSQPPLTELY
ncbi:hypothetical protein FRC19_008718 [Serendipita sp. 401]|nr:hypothetical protein FRC19_008718 [Serendipita sp. 401]